MIQNFAEKHNIFKGIFKYVRYSMAYAKYRLKHLIFAPCCHCCYSTVTFLRDPLLMFGHLTLANILKMSNGSMAALLGWLTLGPIKANTFPWTWLVFLLFLPLARCCAFYVQNFFSNRFNWLIQYTAWKGGGGERGRYNFHFVCFPIVVFPF